MPSRLSLQFSNRQFGSFVSPLSTGPAVACHSKRRARLTKYGANGSGRRTVEICGKFQILHDILIRGICR